MGRFEFPRVDLGIAIEVARAVLEVGGTPKLSTIAAFLKMEESGGGFRVKVTAAKSFGLIDGREAVQVTENGRKILRPISDDERQMALKEALLTPPLYNKLISRYANGSLPDKEILKNILVREYGVPDKSVVQIVGNFIRSVEFYNQQYGTPLEAASRATPEEPTALATVESADGNAIRIFMPGLDDALIRIETEEDWEVVESIIKSMKRKWKKRKEGEAS